MTGTITCPKCGHDFEPTQAMQNRLREQIQTQMQEQYQQRLDDLDREQQRLKKNEAQLSEAREAVKADAEAVQDKVQTLLRQKEKELQRKAMEKARADSAEEYQEKLAEEQDRASRLKDKLKEAQGREAALLKGQRELEEKQEAWELEKERQLAELRKSIRSEEQKVADDRHALKLREREETIGALKKQLEEAHRRAEQGSQQSQGEAFELELEDLLGRRFPEDRVEPVPKGVHGGDVLHRVYSGGIECGTILWESKQTKSYQASWLAKLRRDQRAAKADVAVLATTAMPDDCSTFALRDEVWVTSRTCIEPVATVLRSGVMRAALVARANEGRTEKMHLLYSYLTGPEFRLRMEGLVDAYAAMRKDLDDEKRALMRQWSKREKQLDFVVQGLSGFYGDLQGIAGQSIEGIEVLRLPGSPNGESADD